MAPRMGNIQNDGPHTNATYGRHAVLLYRILMESLPFVAEFILCLRMIHNNVYETFIVSACNHCVCIAYFVHVTCLRLIVHLTVMLANVGSVE
jgi:hypothetical protein